MKKISIISALCFFWVLLPAFNSMANSLNDSSKTALNPFDGQVESVNHAEIAAQVSGQVTHIRVTAGQKVKRGDVLLELESKSADQQAQASEAQIAAANAELALAEKDFQRQLALFKEEYISQAAFDRAQTKYEAAKAQSKATLSIARAARAQSDLYIIKAPFTGLVAEVPVNEGELAMPGRLLVSLYDPEHLRVSAAIPQSAVDKTLTADKLKIEIPSLNNRERWLSAKTIQIFPTIDSQSHTVLLRLNLDKPHDAIKPGLFARVWLPTDVSQPSRVLIPLTAIIQRGEMTGVYVKSGQGDVLLRQVRVGRQWGDQVEILSGLTASDTVVDNPATLSFEKAQ